MPRPRVDTPLWLRPDPSGQREVRFPKLTREIDVDVAIVGGGVTGAALAWRFGDAGVPVALVEGKRVGRGSTAASTALLMQEPDTDLGELTRRFGRIRARRIWQLSGRATRDFVETLTRLDIDCDLIRRDSIYYAAAEEDGHSCAWNSADARRRASTRDGWKPRFRMLNTDVVATRPLTASERRRIGPGAVMLWDTERPYHYARWTSDTAWCSAAGTDHRCASTSDCAPSTRAATGPRGFCPALPGPGRHRDRLSVGGIVRHDA